jgi:hypothetical protein
MMNNEITKESFLRNVSQHKLTIIKDLGLDRHIRLKIPGSTWKYFDIITWKGHLCYTGDMGSYLFSRTDDMFGFFRSDNGDLRPNFNYWSEKILAADRNSGVNEYSEEVFIQIIKDWRLERVREMRQYGTSNKKERRTFWEDVQSEILDADYEYEYPARQLIEDWNYSHKENQCQDFWETDLTDWSYKYEWACWAIQWSIKEYDRIKEIV